MLKDNRNNNNIIEKQNNDKIKNDKIKIYLENKIKMLKCQLIKITNKNKDPKNLNIMQCNDNETESYLEKIKKLEDFKIENENIIILKDDEISKYLGKINELEDIKKDDEESLLFLENKINLLQEQMHLGKKENDSQNL